MSYKTELGWRRMDGVLGGTPSATALVQACLAQGIRDHGAMERLSQSIGGQLEGAHAGSMAQAGSG